MPKLLIFDAFTLLIREKNVAIYALLRCKMSQFTHFCGVKFLASKSGTWEFWTNFMSALCLIVFFSLCELVFHCIHLCVHRSHSLVLILLWVVCAGLKLLSLGVCFSAHNVNLMDRLNIAFPFSTIVFAFCMDNNVGPCW